PPGASLAQDRAPRAATILVDRERSWECPAGNAAGGRDEASMAETITPVSLRQETEERYLTYAMSVITSRALPDVRDGLKPVQRRILYTMYHDLHLTFDGRPTKSSKIVGDVMGNYHPHGDVALYDALVRLAQ